MLDPQKNQSTLPVSRRVAGLCYALFTLACIWPLWPLFLVGLAIKLTRQKRAKGTWLESHFEWQKNALVVAFVTYAACLALASGMLGLLPFGDVISVLLRPYAMLVMAVTSIWLAWRMISGWQQLHRYLPMGVDPEVAVASVASEGLARPAQLGGSPAESTPTPIPAAQPENLPSVAKADIASSSAQIEESPVKGAVRSLNLTALIVCAVINIVGLIWVADGLEEMKSAGPGSAIMGVIYGAIWLGLAAGGTVIYGIFLSVAWLSAGTGKAEITEGGPRKNPWLAIALCLGMILINWLTPVVLA